MTRKDYSCFLFLQHYHISHTKKLYIISKYMLPHIYSTQLHTYQLKNKRPHIFFFFSHIITYIQNTHYFGIYSSPHLTNLHTLPLKRKRLVNDLKGQLKSLYHIKHSTQNLTTHLSSINRNNFSLTLTLTFTLSLT